MTSLQRSRGIVWIEEYLHFQKEASDAQDN